MLSNANHHRHNDMQGYYSYANTFGRFVLDDYAEMHLIDMRFFREKVSGYIAENGITEVLVLYNIPNFCEDTGAAKCF